MHLHISFVENLRYDSIMVFIPARDMKARPFPCTDFSAFPPWEIDALEAENGRCKMYIKLKKLVM